MPRHTNDPKMITKIFRINETHNAYVNKQASERGMNVSEWLRNLIERDMRSNL